jgi:hypothetical protein
MITLSKTSALKTAGAVAAILALSLPLAAQAQSGYGQYAAQPHYAGPSDPTDAPPPPPPPPPGTQTGPNTYAANGAPQDASRGAPPPQGDRRYDGYCYERKDQAQASGTIIGAVAGGFLGNSVSRPWNRGSSTVAGALLGAVLGNSIGKSSVECYGGRYYAYNDGYYAPPPPPDGYTVVYYERRPPVEYYHDVVVVDGPGYYYGRPYYYRPYYHRHW